MQTDKLSILLFIIFLSACQSQPESRIYYINSYHGGYGSSDSIMAGMERVFEDKEVELQTFFMDTKRNSEDSFIAAQVNEILKEIDDYQPDVIIASDDNAVKYVIEPHFKNGEIPVLFCGVNWSAEQYGLPSNNVSGMLEVLPLRQLLGKMKNYYPEANHLTVLSENTTSEQNNKNLLDTLYQAAGFDSVKYALVDNFESWKSAFLRANDSSDIIYIPTNGAVSNWDKGAAIDFVNSNIKQPTVTCDDFMMPYAVLGLTKIASEQGEWVAQKALEVLDGKNINNIELTKSKEYICLLNDELAQKIQFSLNEKDMDECEKLN